MNTIELIQIPKYRSPSGYTIIYSAVSGERTVYSPNKKKMTILEDKSPELQEVYDLINFAEEHRKHNLTTINLNDESHN